MGIAQQDIFPKVLQVLKDAGLSWTARNKNQLEPFYLTLVSVSFIEALLEEFDEVPELTTVIKSTASVVNAKNVLILTLYQSYPRNVF
jgi:hypothetical protein